MLNESRMLNESLLSNEKQWSINSSFKEQEDFIKRQQSDAQQITQLKYDLDLKSKMASLLKE